MKTLSLIPLLALLAACSPSLPKLPPALPTATTIPSQTPAPSPTPATELTLTLAPNITLKLRQIPAGKFLMGSPDTEKDRNPDELQHEVTLTHPFYIGITHVTVEQFTAFIHDTGYKTEAEKSHSTLSFQIKDGKLVFNQIENCSWRNPGYPQQNNHPVVQITQEDAYAFCNWLTQKTGKTIDLPTEAQWEYACRAGTTTAYPWGDNPHNGEGYANVADQTLGQLLLNMPYGWQIYNFNDHYAFTSPVASFKSNAWGLYDMTGNAWQWCKDRHADYTDQPATDPTGPGTAGTVTAGPPSGNATILRGAGWGYGPGYGRCAYRGKYTPGDWTGDFGMRIVINDSL